MRSSVSQRITLRGAWAASDERGVQGASRSRANQVEGGSPWSPLDCDESFAHLGGLESSPNRRVPRRLQPCRGARSGSCDVVVIWVAGVGTVGVTGYALFAWLTEWQPTRPSDDPTQP